MHGELDMHGIMRLEGLFLHQQELSDTLGRGIQTLSGYLKVHHSGLYERTVNV